MEASEMTDPYAKLSETEIRSLEDDYLFPTYRRYELFVDRGEGPYVFDLQGRRYLDFLAGIAVNSLGYNHPRFVRVLQEQGRRVVHCSNLFYHSFQGALAKKLADLSGLSRAFFTNSGTEAVEAALKIARAYGHRCGTPDKSDILTLKNSFHGRTLGALSITAQEKYQAPFRPLVPGIHILEEISAGALERAFSDRVCAVIVEPIQGEGGVFPMPAAFLEAARRLCTDYDALLIFDEIQCGLGRTGKYFAFQNYGIEPDLLTLAKSLAGGYPLGAVLGNERVAGTLQAGEHGTTFGGGPLACRLALEALDIIGDEGLLDHVSNLGGLLMQKLHELAQRHPSMGEIRGMGLIIGIELGSRANKVVKRMLERGVITNVAHESVLRLLPPFVIGQGEVAEFLRILDEVLTEVEGEAAAGQSAGERSV